MDNNKITMILNNLGKVEFFSEHIANYLLKNKQDSMDKILEFLSVFELIKVFLRLSKYFQHNYPIFLHEEN